MGRSKDLAQKFSAQMGATLVPTNAECPLRILLDLIGDRWSILILAALSSDAKRFSELKRTVPTISKRMLTQTLQALAANGLVDRTVTPSVPPQVTYSLTGLGHSFITPLLGLVEWVDENSARIVAARQHTTHRC